MPVSARGVEQAIPRGSALDWGGKTPRRESERKRKMLFNAGPRSLSAEALAHPSQGRDRPRPWLADTPQYCCSATPRAKNSTNSPAVKAGRTVGFPMPSHLDGEEAIE
jgi:hypothetical protein